MRRAPWAAAAPQAEAGPAASEEADWHPRWGDRAQELAWIGIGMDEAALRWRCPAPYALYEHAHTAPARCTWGRARPAVAAMQGPPRGACRRGAGRAPLRCPLSPVSCRRAMLDGALLTEEETAAGPAAWRALDAPLPPWEEAEEAEVEDDDRAD